MKYEEQYVGSTSRGRVFPAAFMIGLSARDVKELIIEALHLVAPTRSDAALITPGASPGGYRNYPDIVFSRIVSRLSNQKHQRGVSR